MKSEWSKFNPCSVETDKNPGELRLYRGYWCAGSFHCQVSSGHGIDNATSHFTTEDLKYLCHFIHTNAENDEQYKYAYIYVHLLIYWFNFQQQLQHLFDIV